MDSTDLGGAPSRDGGGGDGALETVMPAESTRPANRNDLF